MAKALSTQTLVQRGRAAGYSRKQLAQAYGVSVSTVGRIERGQSSGASIAAPAREFYKLGKGAKANVVSGQYSLPSQKPPAPARVAAPKGKHPNAKKVAKALKELLTLDKKGVDKIVIYINVPGTGKSFTLGAHGGISINEILKAGSLQEFLEEQAKAQRYKIKLLPNDEDSEPGSEDWESTNLVDSIVFEEWTR